MFDAVTDPLTGSISDTLRHRWGRRHPFMYASAVPLGLFFALVFNPPDGLGQWGLFAWLTTFAVLTRGAMTLYHVPHLALGAELSTDYRERSVIVCAQRNQNHVNVIRIRRRHHGFWRQRGLQTGRRAQRNMWRTRQADGCACQRKSECAPVRWRGCLGIVDPQKLQNR